MNTLKIFFKKIKWLFIILGCFSFIMGYAFLLFYIKTKFSMYNAGIEIVGVLIIVVGPAIIVGLYQLGKWFKKSWVEAKQELETLRVNKALNRQVDDEEDHDEEDEDIDKIMSCLYIAQKMLPNASDDLIESQAADLMRLPDSCIRSTIRRLEILESAQEIKQKESQKKVEPKLLSRYDIAKQE